MTAQAVPGTVSIALTLFVMCASGAAHCRSGGPVLLFPVHVAFSPARLHAAPIRFFPGAFRDSPHGFMPYRQLWGSKLGKPNYVVLRTYGRNLFGESNRMPPVLRYNIASFFFFVNKP